MSKRKPLPAGMKAVKVVIPEAIDELLNKRAAGEPTSKQALLAPLIKAFALGQIQQGYTLAPDAHGNAGSRKQAA